MNHVRNLCSVFAVCLMLTLYHVRSFAQEHPKTTDIFFAMRKANLSAKSPALAFVSKLASREKFFSPGDAWSIWIIVYTLLLRNWVSLSSRSLSRALFFTLLAIANYNMTKNWGLRSFSFYVCTCMNKLRGHHMCWMGPDWAHEPWRQKTASGYVWLKQNSSDV